MTSTLDRLTSTGTRDPKELLNAVRPHVKHLTVNVLDSDMTLWDREVALLLRDHTMVRDLAERVLANAVMYTIGQWAARAERQRLLRERPNTAFSFIVEEQLLLRRTGGTATTRDLIDHLLDVSELRNVEIQVMPLVRESHAGLHGPMQLLETSENKWFAYTEAPESCQLLADRKVVSVLQGRYARMRSQALTIPDSVGLLQRMRGDP